MRSPRTRRSLDTGPPRCGLPARLVRTPVERKLVPARRSSHPGSKRGLNASWLEMATAQTRRSPVRRIRPLPPSGFAANVDGWPCTDSNLASSETAGVSWICPWPQGFAEAGYVDCTALFSGRSYIASTRPHMFARERSVEILDDGQRLAELPVTHCPRHGMPLPLARGAFHHAWYSSTSTTRGSLTSAVPPACAQFSPCSRAASAPSLSESSTRPPPADGRRSRHEP